MSATIAQQIDRVQILLQDADATAFGRPLVLEQHQDEISRLGRTQRVGDIQLIVGVSGQSLYTLTGCVGSPVLVLYNGNRLEYASEEFLDRKYDGWEWSGTEEPQYWTMRNQAPDTLRVIPAPLRTGSSAPVVPPVPFALSLVDNLVVFVWRDYALRAGDEADFFPLLDSWEDVCVWRTAAELARRETPFQNQPLANTATAMADLWTQLMDQ